MLTERKPLMRVLRRSHTSSSSSPSSSSNPCSSPSSSSWTHLRSVLLVVASSSSSSSSSSCSPVNTNRWVPILVYYSSPVLFLQIKLIYRSDFPFHSVQNLETKILLLRVLRFGSQIRSESTRYPLVFRFPFLGSESVHCFMMLDLYCLEVLSTAGDSINCSVFCLAFLLLAFELRMNVLGLSCRVRFRVLSDEFILIKIPFSVPHSRPLGCIDYHSSTVVFLGYSSWLWCWYLSKFSLVWKFWFDLFSCTCCAITLTSWSIAHFHSPLPYTQLLNLMSWECCSSCLLLFSLHISLYIGRSLCYIFYFLFIVKFSKSQV